MKSVVFTLWAVIYGLIFPSANITHLRIVADKPRFSIRSVVLETEAAYGLPYGLLWAVGHVESGNRDGLTRFEPHVKKRVKPGRGWSRRDLASSHGRYQVMGYHGQRLGLSPEQLADPAINAEVAASILADCKQRRRTWRKALLCYNGGADKTYPKKIARAWEAARNNLQ